ncbi:Cthe_2314 family HEPN domain-containing protein [Staphylococcus equorum]|uniref:Cthe_2314 family HEPN domain-containing protein n=1 Tax=Staphylococcus equorum TaxID=246432 RepID=UPI0020402AD6|nr:Cthe_2314 family HEPN domain-containing protein [Staphylococcus equorum]MCM3071751.1 Cthe_2314 family HEPN domain-containing protein [Staphylococcus equorum]
MNYIKYFNGIESASLDEYSKNVNERLSKILDIEKKGDSYEIKDFTSGLEFEHWKRILGQRNSVLLLSYNAAMYYFEKGIHDDEFFKDSKKINWENHLNFKYFSENFLLTAFSILENIGYLLKVFYKIKLKKQEFVSFSTIVQKLNGKKAAEKYDLKNTEELLNRLNNIKLKDQRYKNLTTVRNDISHNNPPLILTNPVTEVDEITTVGTGVYKSSNDIRKIMDEFLEIYIEIIDILFEISILLNKK